jgi:hypothetical protein
MSVELTQRVRKQRAEILAIRDRLPESIERPRQGRRGFPWGDTFEFGISLDGDDLTVYYGEIRTPWIGAGYAAMVTDSETVTLTGSTCYVYAQRAASTPGTITIRTSETRPVSNPPDLKYDLYVFTATGSTWRERVCLHTLHAVPPLS